LAQIKIGDPHGLFRVFVGLIDSSGYQFGTSGPGVVAGTVCSPYNIRFAQNAEIAMPDRTVIDFTGGDIWTGSYVYGITSLGTFQLTLSTVEADLIAMLSDSAVDQTQNTRTTVFSDNIMKATPPQVFMMIVFRIQSKESGSKGANKFLTLVMPRVWVTPKGISGAPAFQAAGTYNFTIVPTVGDRMPWGPLFSAGGMDLEEDETPVFYMITDNPVHTVTMIAAAGATETVQLPYKVVGATLPISSPDSGTDPLQEYINGTQYDATSIGATSLVTTTNLAAASFTGGEIIGIFYETDYTPQP